MLHYPLGMNGSQVAIVIKELEHERLESGQFVGSESSPVRSMLVDVKDPC